MEWLYEFFDFSPMEESLPPTMEVPMAMPMPMSIPMPEPHYESHQVHDLEMTVSGNASVPDNSTMKGKEKEVAMQDMGSPSNSISSEPKTNKDGTPRRKKVLWTADEHQLFLMGLNNFGKGDWKNISRYYVISKTDIQVASHAQKYYRRQNSSTPADRRRPSINDITTVNAATAATPMTRFTSAISTIRTFHHSYGLGAQVLTPFMPANACNVNNNNSFFFASPGNH